MLLYRYPLINRLKNQIESNIEGKVETNKYIETIGGARVLSYNNALSVQNY